MTAAPASDELEVSIFGPGRGECVVAHVGGGDWLVVDSCLDSATKTPVALRYLGELGVDPASIKLIVVTHWDDDHINGVSRVLEAAPNAGIAISQKHHPDIFEAIAAAEDSNLSDTGLDELGAVFRLLQDRALPGQRRISASPIWASEGTLLFRGVTGATATALSPSAATQMLAMRQWEAILPERHKPQRRAVAVTPNQRSIAVWVSSEVEGSVLLGGDLEQSGNPAVGWTAVVQSDRRPDGVASVFKVPHHGSENADNPDVWTEMLVTRPHALVAPFAGGRKPRPSEDDVVRIKGRTDLVYCTAPPRGWKPARRDEAVEKTIREVASSRRQVVGDMGQVRLRFPPGTGYGGEAIVTIVPPAYQV